MTMRPRSMRARLLIQILPLVATAVAALTTVAVKVASDHERAAVYGQIQQQIGREAQRFQTDAAAHFAVAHDLAADMEGDPRHDRVASAGIVTRTGALHPDIFGTWVAYEPNAFDGRDAEYAPPARGPLGDHDGRFAIWASHTGGKLNLIEFDNSPPNVPWETEEYYRGPLDSNADYVVQPYLDTGTMMTSYTTPIRRHGKAIGVAGVDIALSTLDAQTKAIKVLRSGYAFVAAPNGLLVSFPAHKGWAGKKSAREIGLPALRGPVEATDPITHRDVIVFTARVPTGGW